MLTDARHDSEHLHTKMRAGGPQIVSFIHSLNAGKVFIEYFPCARNCVKYWGPNKIQAMRNSKGGDTDLNK